MYDSFSFSLILYLLSLLLLQIFGQVFLTKAKDLSLAQGLPLDAYKCAPSSTNPSGVSTDIRDAPSSIGVEHAECNSWFNRGRPLADIARLWQPRPVDEKVVIKHLVEGERLGLQVSWEKIEVPRQTMERVGLAVDIALIMESYQRDPLAFDFPIKTLMQLLPDMTTGEVLVALGKLRQQRIHGASPPCILNGWATPATACVSLRQQGSSSKVDGQLLHATLSHQQKVSNR